MTKTELISAVADKTDFTKKNAETAVNAIIATITDACRQDVSADQQA